MANRNASPNANHILPMLLLVGIFLGFASAQETPDLEEQAIREAAQRVAPSVVRIETLGGREKVEEMLVGEGPTTGLVIDAEGYILSSSFNFVHEPASILVVTPSGKRAAAKIVARDRARMLVLLKIVTAEKLPVPEIAPREEFQVGQYAIAVGRTLEGSQPNLSVGVLSALERAYGRAVQTDAKISPANYGGALIDIQGRVMGVLTPLPIMGEGELAGAQFYDSGIGFAAPLSDWLPRLETLKNGTDLQPGLLGISLQPGDVYALPAKIAVCQLNAPAYKAGLRAGDVIVEVDGQKIVRQVQLRHALGKHYAGESVKLVALRGEMPVEATITLVDHLEPYEYPMLGILPRRGTEGVGLVVRAILPKSAAEQVGLQREDRILLADEKPAVDVETLQQLVAAHNPEQPFQLKVQRGEETLELSVKLTPLNSAVPADLPPAAPDKLPELTEKPETGLLEVKLPEEKQECFTYVPASYHPAVPHALVVWFSPPGQFEKAEVETRWKNLAEKYGFIVMAPRPGEAGKWNPSEIAVVRKFMDNLVSRYNIDRTRIVLHGRQVGGTMAWFTALSHRNLVRGVAPLDAPLPPRADVQNDPVNRLHVYSLSAKETSTEKAVLASEERLRTAKVPLITESIPTDRELSPAELEALARWIDALDRI